MKQKLLTIIIVLGLGAGVSIGYTISHSDSHVKKQVLSAQTQVKSPAANTILVEPGIPQKISIPKIKVQTDIESVGMDSEGRMATPKNSDNTAWFSPGFRPGIKGSAVLDGHYDKANGGPAVFWNLGKLEKGDSIVITDNKGAKYTFAVDRTVKYPYDSFPIKEVFAASDVPMLNLITCHGVWNKDTKNYSQRMVVYAKLVAN